MKSWELTVGLAESTLKLSSAPAEERDYKSRHAEDGHKPRQELFCSARKQEEYKDESTWPCMTILYRRKIMFFLKLPDFCESYLKNSLNRMVNNATYLSECFGNWWCSYGFDESGTVLKIWLNAISAVWNQTVTNESWSVVLLKEQQFISTANKLPSWRIFEILSANDYRQNGMNPNQKPCAPK